jgi:hypothetical protein
MGMQPYLSPGSSSKRLSVTKGMGADPVCGPTPRG